MLGNPKLYLMVFGLAAAFPAMVSAARPDAGQLLNEQQRMQQNRFDSFSREGGTHKERAVPKEVVGIKVRVQAIRFSGDVGVVGEDQLQAVVRDALGKDLDFNGLQNLADKVSDYLQEKGYFLAHAYLPKQYLTGGVVEIAILAGRLQNVGESVVIQGGLRIPSQRLLWIAEGTAKPGEVVRKGDLERAVLLINDIPGISAISNVERGSEAGEVRLVVNANEGPLFSGELGMDNFGNDYTGSLRGTARFNVNDPLRFGDQLSLSVAAASDFQMGQVTYGWPVNYRGLRAAISYGAMSYTIGKGLADLNSSGSSSILGAGVSYPIIRSRFLNLWGSLNYATKTLEDATFGETVRNRDINTWIFGLSGDSYDYLGGGGLFNYSAILTSGNLDLSKEPVDFSVDQSSGAHTNGGYTKLNYNLARLQRLSNYMSLFGAINGQFASKNLDTSEKFFLGGPSGVRAYPIGEAAGDEGWVTNLELRYELPVLSRWGNVQLIGFFDTGQITLHKEPWTSSILTSSGKNSYTLSGVGIGLNLTKATKYTVRTAWATKIGDNPGSSLTGLDSDGKNDSSRFWLYGVLWW